MMSKKSVGLYIHIPFCLKRCNYCDFCSYDKLSDADKDAYTGALCAELERESPLLDGYRVDTVFFGGGTPSLLSNEQMENIFSALRKNYICDKDIEISLEINPATAKKEKLELMKSLGVNRLSIGMQSANDEELRLLGRAHNKNDFQTTYNLARSVGFDNINVDLMYGIPNQTAKTFERTLDYAVSLDCEHLSVYGLKIEEGTPFHTKRDSLILPDEDEEYQMYINCAEKLSSVGFLHYEISNYAKKGRECKHNLRYWRDCEYIGFGVSAYSYFNRKRYGNSYDIKKYIENKGECEKINLENIGEKEREYEYIMLALRLREGIRDRDFYSRFGVLFSEKYEKPIKSFENSEFFRVDNGRFYLTDKGMYVSNSIICDFLEELNK